MLEGSKSPLRIVFTVTSMLISLVHFILFSSIALDVYEVYGGYRAFVALISIILLGILEVTFAILIFKVYSCPTEIAIRRFLRCSGFQMLLFPIWDILRIFIFRPFYRSLNLSFMSSLRIEDFAIGGSGLLLAVILFVLVFCIKRKKDRAIS